MKCLVCYAAVFVKLFPFPLLVAYGVTGVSVLHSDLLCQMSFLLKGNCTIKTLFYPSQLSEVELSSPLYLAPQVVYGCDPCSPDSPL